MVLRIAGRANNILLDFSDFVKDIIRRSTIGTFVIVDRHDRILVSEMGEKVPLCKMQGFGKRGKKEGGGEREKRGLWDFGTVGKSPLDVSEA